MTHPIATVALTERELMDIRSAVRAHRRTLAAAADRGEQLGIQAGRLGLLGIRLTAILDALEQGAG